MGPSSVELIPRRSAASPFACSVWHSARRPRYASRMAAEGVELASDAQARWPNANGRRVVFLLDAASPLERRTLESWIDATRPPNVDRGKVEIIPIPPTRRRSRRGRLDPRLEASLTTGDDPLLAPLRVAWLPE